VTAATVITFMVTDSTAPRPPKNLEITIGLVLISIDAPATVPVGGTFDVSIDISQVTDLNAWQFDLGYDNTVVQVNSFQNGDGVTAGLVDSTNMPLDFWVSIPNGVFDDPTTGNMIRVPGRLPSSGLSGSTSGSAIWPRSIYGTGRHWTTSPLHLENVFLADRAGNSIEPLATADGSVRVVSPDSIPPEVTSVSPLNGSTGVALNAAVIAISPSRCWRRP